MASSFASDVYERSGSDEMSRRAFYLVIGGLLSWGFLATSIVAEMCVDWKPNTLTFFVVGLGIPLIGILLSMGGAFLSFIGYHLVLIPFGAILGPWLAHMNLSHPGVVHQAAFLTAAVSAVMGGTGVLYPNFYRGIGGALFGALLALLVVSVISLFVPALAHLAVIHWIAAGIFALYIGYDMWRASDVPATLDNAVDIAISLYLDVINLFLRIASILSSDD